MLLPHFRNDGELVMTLVTTHLVRLLKTAPSLQVLDAATFAIQVSQGPTSQQYQILENSNGELVPFQ